MNNFIPSGVIFCADWNDLVYFTRKIKIDGFAKLLECSQAGEILNTPKKSPPHHWRFVN
jgi:hypothetical protein